MNISRFVVFLLVSIFVLPELYFRIFHVSSWEAYKGSWAVVTGSSYGIGRDVALELGSRGLNVVVHGRSKDKLQALCRELQEQHHVQCKVIIQDVLDPKWDTIPSQLEGLDISTLVSNVGGGSPGLAFTLFVFETTQKKVRVRCSV